MLLDLVWLLGVITLGLLSPGPDFLLIVKNSVGGSRRRGLGTAGGIATGLAVQVSAISLGLGAIPAAHLRVVQLIGVALLAYIGLRALLTRPGEPEAVRPAALPARGGFAEGLLCNVTNAKAFVFFVSLFAQVIRPEASGLWRILVPVVIVVHGWVMWTLIVLALQSPPVAHRLGRAQHWLPRVFGGALVLVAAVVLVGALR